MSANKHTQYTIMGFSDFFFFFFFFFKGAVVENHHGKFINNNIKYIDDA